MKFSTPPVWGKYKADQIEIRLSKEIPRCVSSLGVQTRAKHAAHAFVLYTLPSGNAVFNCNFAHLAEVREPIASTTNHRKASMRALLIIPAYNEAENIERVVDDLIQNYPNYDYVVVNDGSRDGTADICREHGYRFLDLPINLGLAGAFQAGTKYAVSHGYDCAIQFDADGQHLPKYLDSLVAELEHSDIVIGSRFVTETKPNTMRMFGSNLIQFMIKLTTGKTIKDPTSGMRCYNRKALKILSSGPNLGPEPDTVAWLMRKHGLEVSEVQVEMAERIAGESYLNLRSSVAYMTRMALTVLFIQFFR